MIEGCHAKRNHGFAYDLGHGLATPVPRGRWLILSSLLLILTTLHPLGVEANGYVDRACDSAKAAHYADKGWTQIVRSDWHDSVWAFRAAVDSVSTCTNLRADWVYKTLVGYATADYHAHFYKAALERVDEAQAWSGKLQDASSDTERDWGGKIIKEIDAGTAEMAQLHLEAANRGTEPVAPPVNVNLLSVPEPSEPLLPAGWRWDELGVMLTIGTFLGGLIVRFCTLCFGKPVKYH